ncbi:MAG: hypothetical protein V1801_01325 [Candidatus Falkowbacteria bacterium]
MKKKSNAVLSVDRELSSWNNFRENEFWDDKPDDLLLAENEVACAIDGKRVFSLSDISEVGFTDLRDQASRAVKMNDDCRVGFLVEVITCRDENTLDGDDDRLDTKGKMMSYYRKLYPECFQLFHYDEEKPGEFSTIGHYGCGTRLVKPKKGYGKGGKKLPLVAQI